MKLNGSQLRLYAVTDRAWAADEDALMDQIAAAIDGGAGIVQLREKHLDHDAFLKEAKRFVALCREKGAVSIINDDVDIALAAELDAVFTDIYPDAVKIGMVSSSALIEVIADKLRQYGAERIVVDPVMVATSGARLISETAVETLKERLLPLATVLTPNIPEAELLAGMTITGPEGMEAAARTISERYGCAVLCKGGHQINDADDLLWRKVGGKWFRGRRIDNPNTHGTGCTLSSAIASNLAKGHDLDTSVERAKEYISGALSAQLDLGRGAGPMNHMFDLKGAFVE